MADSEEGPDLNLKVYRCQSWPYAFQTYALLAWSEVRGSTSFTAFIIPDDGEEESFVGTRYRLRNFEDLLYLGAEVGSVREAQVQLLHDLLKGKILAMIDKAWEDEGRPGRPVDVVELKDGSLLISDDYQGVIYRVVYTGD